MKDKNELKTNVSITTNEDSLLTSSSSLILRPDINDENILNDSLTLSPKHIVPIAPDKTNCWVKRKLVLSERTRTKYNDAACTAVNITPEGSENLRNKYHKIHGLPSFVHRFLHARPTLARAFFMVAPEMYKIFDSEADDSKTILMTNPEYLNCEKFLSDYRAKSLDFALKQLKDSDNGLALVTWYIHPETLPLDLKNSESLTDIFNQRRNKLYSEALNLSDDFEQQFHYYRFGSDISLLSRMGSFSKLPRSPSQEKISDLEERSEIPYLASLFDLDIDREKSLRYLESMRDNILMELESVYGVTHDDKVKIYLHLPYLEVTTTLHIHIRVNQADHALETAKSFGLNEIIEQLKSGHSVTEMILDRGTIFCSEYPIGEDTDGVVVTTVPNPYRDWDDIFSILKIEPLVRDYLLTALQSPEINNRMQLLHFNEIKKLANQLVELTDLPDEDGLVMLINDLDVDPKLEQEGWCLSGFCLNNKLSG